MQELNEAKPTILKIGGSVITDKNGELAARTEVINRLAEETHKAGVKNLIMVHGGGSFGHPIAQKYGIKEGFKDGAQKIGFAETHHVMTVLNGLVMDALVWHSIPAFSIAPSCCMVTENGMIKLCEDTALKTLLKMGFVPVLYGDAVLDEKLGFTVLSGDQIISYLARKFGAGKIVIGVDTDGLYDADPKVTKNAKLYTHLTLNELEKIKSKLDGSSAPDVTGGMLGKIAELVPALQQGIPVAIVNASKPNRVFKSLVGEKVEGTFIEKA
ncbi:isopentenyl phosphate kinase family protein [Candidatus Bathyarchaeota archaeon]|nr:isopentenyl phosphate kinase family protein [Candidatus Bathyarchaeota archaeon]